MLNRLMGVRFFSVTRPVNQLLPVKISEVTPSPASQSPSKPLIPFTQCWNTDFDKPLFNVPRPPQPAKEAIELTDNTPTFQIRRPKD